MTISVIGLYGVLKILLNVSKISVKKECIYNSNVYKDSCKTGLIVVVSSHLIHNNESVLRLFDCK